MEKYEQTLKAVQDAVYLNEKLISKASAAILEQEISDYPIFVAHTDPLELGIPLMAPTADTWGIRGSTLEEFAARKLVDLEKIDSFKEVYKPVDKFYCLFIIQENMATFAFIPRKSM